MASEPLRVLIVEDAVADAELIGQELARAGLRCTLRRVDALATFEAALEQFAPDLILSDFTLPGNFDGLAALELAQRKYPEIPFVFVSGTLGEARAVETLQRGAADYVLKDRLAALGPAVLRTLEVARLRREKQRAEAAQGESEARYRELIEQASDGIFVTDREGKLLLANSRFCEMLGYSGVEMLQRNIADTYPEEEREDFVKHLAHLPADKNRLLERAMRRQDGTCFPVEISVRFTARGTHEGFVRDITERRSQEHKIARLNRIYAVLSSINSAIMRVREPQGLFDEACRIAVEHGGFGIAWIGMLDTQTLDITPAAWAGLDIKEYLGTVKSSARSDHPHGQGVVGRAVRERRPIFSNDLLAEQGPVGFRAEEAMRRGYRSRIALPLLMDGNIIGVMVLFAREKDFFNDEELKLLDELAGNVSFALAHMAKQEKIAKLSRIRAVSGAINSAILRIREPGHLLRETCRIAAEYGGFGLAWIGFVDPEQREVRPVAWAGFSGEVATGVSWESIGTAHGMMSEAISARRPAVRHGVPANRPAGVLRRAAVEGGYHSAICLPLEMDDRVVAVIMLFAREEAFFVDEEIALLTELADDVSFALHHIAGLKKLEYLSYYDALTGLPNRALFIDRAGQQLRARSGEPLMVAVILLNLDRFRNINESFGRQGGDELLRQVARRLESAFYSKDYLARTSADGFGLVLRGMRDAAIVAHAVESQVLECFRIPFVLAGAEIRVSAKAGIAMFPADGGDADTLFRNAEAALRKAGNSGERYLFYAAEMTARAAEALHLETRLRKALDGHQFVLHYQPKILLASGAICGLEALIRWQEPGAGLVPPGTFIPVLEETGLILETGKWVIERALADYREWTARGCSVPRIAVNVSAIQLQQRDFADMVIEIVQQSGSPPEALEIEVTESLLMKDLEASIRKLSALRELGVHIAMDDFGTGYSSLSYVARLPINSVKIDRSFVNGMAASAQDMAIVTTIIALAHSLNLRVVAEGVETLEQAQLLKVLNCDEAQGFLYSKPVPAANIEPVLRSQGTQPAAAPASQGRAGPRLAPHTGTGMKRSPRHAAPRRRKRTTK